MGFLFCKHEPWLEQKEIGEEAIRKCFERVKKGKRRATKLVTIFATFFSIILVYIFIVDNKKPIDPTPADVYFC